ncbi:MAG: non-heme iron oxygenase ferredoxin subunit [Actinomycetes bacterium]
MTFVDACRFGDLEEQLPLRLVLADLPIALVLTGGQLFAVGDKCSHADVSLSEGEVSGCLIECWLHGSSFDLRSGEPTSLPATQPIPTYQVRVEGIGPDAVVQIEV